MSSLTALILSIAFIAPSAAFAQTCEKVAGRFTSSPAATCTSPVGVCTEGTLRGRIRGTYAFTMTTLSPSGAVPTVFFYTGQSEIHTRRGDITAVDTGTLDLNPAGFGPFTALLTLSGGTGRNTGAAGYLQLIGILDALTGRVSGDYVGELCR